MSDYDYYSDDDYLADSNWIYVDEHWDEADDLAEHTCPSPDPIATERFDFVDYDPFSYFEDLNYLSDAYQDENIGTKRGTKRKRGDESKSSSRNAARSRRGKASKRHKSETRSSAVGDPIILWMSSIELYRELGSSIEDPKTTNTSGTALFEDWRERFKDAKGFRVALAAAKSRSDDERGSHARSHPKEEEEEGYVSDDEDEEMGTQNSDSAFNSSDLKAVLAQLSSGGNLASLKEMLEAQGLDPDVLDAVVQDMLEGRERQFPEDEEDVDAEEDEDQSGAAVENGKSSRGNGEESASANSKKRRRDPPEVEQAEATEQVQKKKSKRRR